MATTVFFRRCGMLRSFVVEILQSTKYVGRYSSCFRAASSTKGLKAIISLVFFFSEKRYVAFICFHERSLTKWNNAKIPKISTRIFSMPRPANRERLSTPRTTSEFIAFCQRMKQPDYIYDTRSIAWRNVTDIE